MATTKPRTIILKKIRKRIRDAISWHNVDDGMPHFWTTENYKSGRYIKPPVKGDYPYYVKSSKAIEAIAEKILKEVEEYDKTIC